MRRWLALARSGAVAVWLHPTRSAVTVVAVVAILVPFVASQALLEGLAADGRRAVAFGPDLVVDGVRLGRPAPVPLSSIESVAAIPGVRSVTPRLVGEIRLGRDDEPVILLGLPPERLTLPPGLALVEGRLPSPGASFEWVVGADLARRLALQVGSKVPPFYRNDAGERVTTVVGVFRGDVPIWSGRLVLATYATVEAVFAQQGLATSLLVDVEAGEAEPVRRAIRRLPSLGPPDAFGPVRPRVLTRDDAAALLPGQALAREGVVTLLWMLAFAVGLPVVLVTSGAGLSDRRRETALLKAVGWRTDEALARAFVESVLLAVAAAAAAVLLAALWIGPLRAAGLGAALVPGVDADPAVRLPARLHPTLALLALSISFVLVTVGSLVSTWRAASTPPAEVLR